MKWIIFQYNLINILILNKSGVFRKIKKFPPFHLFYFSQCEIVKSIIYGQLLNRKSNTKIIVLWSFFCWLMCYGVEIIVREL